MTQRPPIENDLDTCDECGQKYGRVAELERRVAELEAMFKEPEAYMVYCSKGEYDAMVFTELQSARDFADSELDDMPESVESVPIYPLYAGKELELEAELKLREGQ